MACAIRSIRAFANSALPEILCLYLVERHPVGGEHDTVLVARRCGGDLAVQHVGQHRGGVAVERIAIARAARDVFPQLIARTQHDHLLGWQLLARAVLADDERVSAGAPRAAPQPPTGRPEAARRDASP